MTAVIHDLRFALRTFVKRPAFTALVVGVLGIGIGAATSVVDLANLLAWRLMPAEQPRELVKIFTDSQQGFIGPYFLTPYSDYVDYRDGNRSLSGLAAHADHVLRLDTGDTTRLVSGSAVTGNFFEVVRPGLALGRALGAEDDRVGADPVLVLGHALWQSLGSSPDLIGQPMKIEGKSFTVIGVVAERFPSTTAGEVTNFYFPITHLPSVVSGASLEPGDGDRASRVYLIGRTELGKEAVQAELGALAAVLDGERPRPGDHARRVTVTAATLTHPIDLERMLPTLRLFSAAVALLLLITCANVAHLILARSSSRRREMAVRRSIGASRTTLVRQLLTESLVLSIVGGICGLALATWCRGLVAAFGSAELAAEMRFDIRVLSTCFLVCLGATLLFGLAPALSASRFDLISALKDGADGGTGRRFPVGRLLAAAQVALCVVLLVAGGLLARSLLHRLDADRGFDEDGLVIAAVDVPESEYDRETGSAFFRRFQERAAALPGVEAASRALIVPPILFDISLPYRLERDSEVSHKSRLNFIDTSYFDTMGIELEEGRNFDVADAESDHGLVIVNRSLAQEAWPGESPLGRVLYFDKVRPGDPEGGYTVIGVASSIDQHRSSHGGEPVFYFHFDQRYRSRQQFVLRTTGDSEMVVTSMRGLLREMDPGLALTQVRTGETNRRNAFAFEEMQTLAVGIFAGLGLLLAVVGIFGVASYSVSRRIHEIGIRMALGASRGDVRREVARRDLIWTLGGAVAGVAVIVIASGYLEHLLFGVTAFDPAVLGAVLGLVLLSATLAIYLPARRASRLDPLRALRHD